MTNVEKLKELFPYLNIVGTVFTDKRTEQVLAASVNFNWLNAEYKEPTTKNDLGDDCISRDAVKYYIQAHIHEIITESGIDKNAHTNRVLRALLNGVDTMPSVTPQPCEDAISRQALLNATVNKNSIWNKITDSKGDNLETIISKLPSVTPQEPFINKPCVSGGVCEHDKQMVLNKIRAKIEQSRYGLASAGLDLALNIIDECIAESEVEDANN